MVDILEKYFEIAISIFLYVTSTALTLTVLVFARDPIAVQGSDKTFVESTGIQQMNESETYGYDILLMLLNTDPMSPYPKAIKINNTPTIKINNEFITYKMKNVGAIYSATGEYKLSTMLNYKVISKKYIYKGPDSPYIQYILEEMH